ncbi:two-component system sensor histidine kinase NtrB [Curvivirga aplysinae]|uniref:two-component system sensor histidine kinase NtrB n=1 Tax=Curvivirga aplysinae TaxID=2529852 RepID=UPI0012BCCF5C|nr:ATP-binding protein [Curvivirga aplysinae]MTI10066.1 PAS domain-containing protein [Curvivirga aplysinae]
MTPDIILNSMPDPVLVVNQKDDISFLNLAAEGFLQGSREQLIGQNLQDLIPQDSPVLFLLSKVRRHGTSYTEHGIILASPKIGSHQVSISAAPVIDDPSAITLVFQHESIAEKLNDNLSQKGAARSVSALAAMLSHEIKNPLSGIRGAAQLLEMIIEPNDRELTTLIKDETDRIVKLLDRMEVFTDNPLLDRSAVNIHEVLDHVVRSAKSGFASKFKIIENYDPSLPAVFGDRDQLVQIFMNLVKNAAEVLEGQDGRITIKTSYRHGVRLALPGGGTPHYLPLMVTIEDNGPGIPDDIRDHLFDPFITTKHNGSGLGLALVAKLVGDHGGAIELDSKPGATKFNVLLPMMKN